MKIIIKTQATIRGMDFCLDLSKQGKYAAEAARVISERMADIGATDEWDGWEETTVTRKDGRGLLSACRAAAKKAGGVYGLVQVCK